MTRVVAQLHAASQPHAAHLLSTAAGNAKGLLNLIACFLPGGGKKAAAKASNGLKDE